ncbi:MAG: UbiX family flavin prenyltransferase [Candidatus Diapherotrites archaeon]
MKLIVAVCGASGINYAITLLKELKKRKIETHLVLSDWAEKLAREECSIGRKELEKMADYCYSENEMNARIASSSFLCEGMIVLPASVKTVSEIATAHTGTLISRCADIMLRTKRKIVVCVRETPLSAPTLKNLQEIALYGGIVMPLSPAFYQKPKTIKDLELFMAGKIMDLFGIKNSLYKRWKDEP